MLVFGFLKLMILQNSSLRPQKADNAKVQILTFFCL